MIRKPLLGGSRGLGGGLSKTLPAPTGGWNTRDNEANMPIEKARVLENWFPMAANVAVRPGCLAWVTGLPAPARSLLNYSNESGQQKLFAGTNAGIFDVTSTGVAGSSLATMTNGYCSSVVFTNVAGAYLIVVNGTDPMLRYDGAAWSQVTAAITGLATSSLKTVFEFKSKLWFLEANSMSAWYLPTNAIQGALTEFPIGQLFQRGGSLVAVDSWTIDGGKGLDDHLVFVTSEGELAIYKGTDPADSTKWELAGVFYLGEPLGKRCLCKYGGDLLYLSQNGLFPLSKALLSTSINYKSALSDEIGPTFAEYSSLYKHNEGWQIVSFPQGSCLFVNVPISTGQRVDQFVMNTVTQAWCRFRAWNALTWELCATDLFFSSGTSVFKAFTGASDNGAAIVADAAQAYTYLGSPGLFKHATLVRPTLKVDVNPAIQVAVLADFDTETSWSVPTMPPASGSVWDTATWDTAVWGGGLQTVRNWYSVNSDEGYCLSVLLRSTSNKSKVIWNATDLIYEKGGML